MAFDFKKEYKELYMPKSKPQIINVPSMNFVAVKGKENGYITDYKEVLMQNSITRKANINI